MAEREKALEDELRQKFPVEIDDKALAGVKVPPTDKAEGPAEPNEEEAEKAHDGGK
jgi:hypothetical protein